MGVEGNKTDSINAENNKKMLKTQTPEQKVQAPAQKTQTPAQKAQAPIQKTQTQIHSAIQQMKVQIKGLPRSKSHHPAEQMYSHRRI